MALLSQREIKISAAVILLLALLAVLITLVVFWLQGSPEEETAAPRQTEETVPAAEEGYESFSLQIPEEYRGIFRPHWIPYRQLNSSWSSAQTEPYWIEPRTLVEEELEKDTDESVRSFLEELP